MAAYSLSVRADADIDALYEYSIMTFGLATARAYLQGLFDRLELLAANPGLGRDYGFVRPDLRRYEHVSHSIYYSVRESGDVLIVRVLGARQDPGRHL